MKPNEHNAIQRRERLQKEIEHFSGRLRSLKEPGTPQEKRQRTIVLRCLSRRVKDLMEHDRRTLSN